MHWFTPRVVGTRSILVLAGSDLIDACFAIAVAAAAVETPPTLLQQLLAMRNEREKEGSYACSYACACARVRVSVLRLEARERVRSDESGRERMVCSLHCFSSSSSSSSSLVLVVIV